MRTIFILALLSSVFFSCTIEKRLHSKGYYVEWNSKNKVSKHSENEKLSSQNEEIQIEDLTILEESKQELSVPEQSAMSSSDNLLMVDTDKDIKNTKEKKQFFKNFEIKESRTISFFNNKIFTSKKVKNHKKKNGEDSSVNVAAIVSLILGIIGLLLVGFLPIVNFIFSIPAIILAIIGMKKSNEHPEVGGFGMSVAGLIFGVLGILLGVLIIIALMLALS